MTQAELFDNYLEDRMDGIEKAAFERRLEADPALASGLRQHKAIIKTLKARAERETLRAKLKDVHEKEFGAKSAIIPLVRGAKFAAEHGRTIAVAASTAFIVVLGAVAVLSAGGYLLQKQSEEITNLNRVVRELKASSDAIIEGISKGKKTATYAPANLEGTAFAISERGYLLTSLHMVRGADSIFIQNKFTERSLATLVHADPRLDLAILKITNEQSSKNWQPPVMISSREAEIGERVFTLGYPRREMVYGEGALSATSGYRNDTAMYQVSIPVNPGNSGGPLLDEQGRVIGVIRSKVSGAEATGFAIKSSAILKAIDSIDNAELKKDFQKMSVKSVKSTRRPEQVKKLHPYVFNVLVYKGE